MESVCFTPKPDVGSGRSVRRDVPLEDISTYRSTCISRPRAAHLLRLLLVCRRLVTRLQYRPNLVICERLNAHFVALTKASEPHTRHAWIGAMFDEHSDERDIARPHRRNQR